MTVASTRPENCSSAGRVSQYETSARIARMACPLLVPDRAPPIPTERPPIGMIGLSVKHDFRSCQNRQEYGHSRFVSSAPGPVVFDLSRVQAQYAHPMTESEARQAGDSCSIRSTNALNGFEVLSLLPIRGAHYDTQRACGSSAADRSGARV